MIRLKTRHKRLPILPVLPVLFALAVPSLPALAGDAEMDLLSSYAGNWRGRAQLKGTSEPETFTCRMTITNSRQARIYYTGRCTLVGLNLSVAGAIVYNDETGRYEATMTSNTAFSGRAVGTINGSSIKFDLKERNPGQQGGEVQIGAQILLSEAKVTVDFQIEFSDAGDTLTTSVPFSRAGA